MADGFLGRWSRRKQEVREGKPVEEPPPPVPSLAPPVSSSAQVPTSVAGAAAPHTVEEGAAPAAEAPPPPTLADAQALTPASDFKAFVARDVSPEVRNLAMKKLFADPHFNVMDGLDIYIGDYTQPDPLPEGMLRKMTSAHALGFFDHEKKADAEVLHGEPLNGAAADPSAQAPADPVPPVVAPPRDGAPQETFPDVAQSEARNATPSDLSSDLSSELGVGHPLLRGRGDPASQPNPT